MPLAICCKKMDELNKPFNGTWAKLPDVYALSAWRVMNRLTLNTAVQILTRGIEYASGILVNAWLARQWGSSAFGEIGFFSGLAGMCIFLFDLGIGQLLVRTIARDRASLKQQLGNALVAILPLSLLASLLLVGLGLMLSPRDSLGVLLLVSLQMFLITVALILRAGFYAFERMERESLAIFSERLLWIFIGLWLSWQKPSLIFMFAGLCLCKLLNVLVSTWLLRDLLVRSGPVHLNWKTQLALVKEALPFGLNACFSTVYVSVDILMLSRLAGNDATGYYRAASMLIVPLVIISVAFCNAIFPHISRIDRDSIGEYLRNSARLLVMAAMPVATFVLLFAEPIIRLFYGKNFLPAVVLLQILVLVIPLRFINHTMGTFLTACDHQNYRTSVTAGAAVFNVIANILIIGPLLAVGACITTILTDLLLLVFYSRKLWGYSRGVGLDAALMLRSLLLSVAILLPLAHFKVPLLVAGGILGLLYPLLLYGTGIISSNEMHLLRRQNVL